MIAEGVETEEEFNYIRDNTDIEYVQGYYLARPN
jgi:EAL domain-containing protein (putative c-di-GMP-specific phosphodiesterase class I)